ncbi:MAG: Dynein light chain 4, axonemal [Paramarteilia canceri]
MSLATDNFRANEGDSAAKSTEDDTKLLFTYPIQRKSTMNEETRVEVFETCVTFCERFANNYEEACKNIKEILDKRFGPAWHVVIGKSYGFEVDSEMNTTFQMFFGGNLAITIWKCS